MFLSESSSQELFNFLENCSCHSILVISGPKATGKSLLTLLITRYLHIPYGIRITEVSSNSEISSSDPNTFVINLMEPISKKEPSSVIEKEFLEYMRQHGVNV